MTIEETPQNLDQFVQKDLRNDFRIGINELCDSIKRIQLFNFNSSFVIYCIFKRENERES